MLTELTIKEFINKVLSNDPVPGGGSVSALNGALATSLAAMVANLTIGRKKYVEVNEIMEDLSVRFEELTRQLITDVDRDSEAYDRVFSAFKLPKETDEEKAIRSEAIQKETKYAAQVPMEVARTVHSILPMIDVVARKGNSNAVTDACVSMMCARTAILGALLNVRINLTSIKDEKFVKEMSEEADMIEQTTIAEEQKILDYVKTIFNPNLRGKKKNQTMKNVYQIGSGDLTFDIIERIINENLKLELAPEAKDRIQKCRDYLDKKIKESDVPLYGITTGFGSLCNRNISSDELSTLQENLVKSHACSVGAEMPHVIVKLMFLLKAHALSLGHSGVQVITVQRIIDFFNNDVMPIVYDRGSLGASGDLAPLANLFLPLIGVGDVYYKGKRCEAISVLDEFGWEPVKLKSKEGLALLNGTQFMSANGVYAILKAFRLSKKADLIAAISLEAFDGRIDPFMDCIQQMRPHKGQIETGAAFRRILEGSEIIAQPKQHVQDPYSFRCIPQVHGATKDAINHVASVLLTEINSVTDNPTIFPDEDLIISGGNFHGQPLALVYDYLAIAMAELGNISERRVAQLIMGLRGLPEFLVANPGLNSGFMIPQYAAASMVSQNKMYCYAASSDSIVSSNGQEDHVSMGANAATKLYKVMDNLEHILAIELMNAAQGLDFRRPLRSSPFIEKFLATYRNEVPFIKEDIVMYKEIHKTVAFLKRHQVNY